MCKKILHVYWGSRGQKRSKNNKIGAQQDRKSRRNLVQNASKLSNDQFCRKIRPTLGLIIFGNIWDRQYDFFCKKRGSMGTQWDRKMCIFLQWATPHSCKHISHDTSCIMWYTYICMPVSHKSQSEMSISQICQSGMSVSQPEMSVSQKCQSASLKCQSARNISQPEMSVSQKCQSASMKCQLARNVSQPEKCQSARNNVVSMKCQSAKTVLSEQ